MVHWYSQVAIMQTKFKANFGRDQMKTRKNEKQGLKKNFTF